jgi:hypothetical protein
VLEREKSNENNCFVLKTSGLSALTKYTFDNFIKFQNVFRT